MDQAHLPGAGSSLDACLPLNGGQDVAAFSGVNQAVQAAAAGEHGTRTAFVFGDAAEACNDDGRRGL